MMSVPIFVSDRKLDVVCTPLISFFEMFENKLFIKIIKMQTYFTYILIEDENNLSKL